MRAAELLENAAIPHDTAAPGTRIVYREDGQERSIRVLGPWDTTGDADVVSYRSPLAQGLLGLRVGAKAKVQLPSGMVEVEVVSVEPLHF